MSEKRDSRASRGRPSTWNFSKNLLINLLLDYPGFQHQFTASELRKAHLITYNIPVNHYHLTRFLQFILRRKIAVLDSQNRYFMNPETEWIMTHEGEENAQNQVASTELSSEHHDHTSLQKRIDELEEQIEFMKSTIEELKDKQNEPHSE